MLGGGDGLPPHPEWGRTNPHGDGYPRAMSEVSDIRRRTEYGHESDGWTVKSKDWLWKVLVHVEAVDRLFDVEPLMEAEIKK